MRIGANVKPSDTATTFDNARALGVRGVRFEANASWDWIGGWTWDFAPLESRLAAYKAAGFTHVGVLFLGVPADWRTEPASDKAPPNLAVGLIRAGWLIYIDAVLTRVLAQKFDFVYAEVWNEPNLPRFWSSTVNATEYARFYRTTVRLVRRIYPKYASIPFVTAGLAPYGDLNNDTDPHMPIRNPLHYSRTMMGYPGMRETVADNGFSVHPYAYDLTDGTQTPKNMPYGWNGARHMIEAVYRYVPPTTPIYVTEFGCPVYGSISATQAAANARAGLELWDETLASRTVIFDWYEIIDREPPAEENRFGLLTTTGAVRPTGEVVTLWTGVEG